MSIHTIQPETSIFDQIFNGLAIGIRYFIRLLVVVVALATVGTLLYTVGTKDSGESGEAVGVHHDIRRNIAVGVRGPAAMIGSAPAASRTEPWQELAPSVGDLANESGFKSKVKVRRVTNGGEFQVILGPYDPEASQNLKASSGWVTLKLFLADGMPVPGMAKGFKIQLSSLEFYEEGSIPVGWIYRGSLGELAGLETSEIRSFSLGWVIPSSTSLRRSSLISQR
ncbi:hypothetical protein [Haloferula sp.]|uniref:hypothetical protein n=1 Tax=Haloferula sp. TaxID=2497595 RepID=UPI00329C22E4